jgi:murein DD-endopeptidase MepM/ murein hydrolase activator NlpD
VWSANKDVDTIRQTFSGSIESSLWNVITGKGANPILAIELSEIYAWSIDFFGLQKGDSIRIIYDELYVDTTSIGIGKIHAAYFRHMNNDFYAIPFVQDSTEEFFDDKGKSLRKAFLKAPLRFSRISSKFSNSRLHPILKIRRPHHGVDYAAPLGTPVQSIGDGKVIKCSYEGGAGHMVKIRHNSIYTTAYLHLSRYGKGIKTGTYVKQGDIIGYVGSSGLSTGPHLDFRFYKNNVPVDPLRVEAPSVDPVREEHMERYLLEKDEVIMSLQSFN